MVIAVHVFCKLFQNDLLLVVLTVHLKDIRRPYTYLAEDLSWLSTCFASQA